MCIYTNGQLATVHDIYIHISNSVNYHTKGIWCHIYIYIYIYIISSGDCDLYDVIVASSTFGVNLRQFCYIYNENFSNILRRPKSYLIPVVTAVHDYRDASV